MPDSSRALAATQHGVVTWQQCLAAGLLRAQVRALLRAGLLLRVVKGAYVEASLWEALDARGRLLAVAHAKVLTREPGWHAARRTSTALHSLPVLGDVAVRPQLVKAPRRHTDRASSRFERLATLAPPEVTVVDGLPCTSLERTAVDVAREESFLSGLVVADGALRAGASQELLLSVAKRCSDWPGGADGVRVARTADGLSTNALESISRARMTLVGLPQPELQVKVYLGARLLAIVDFLWQAYHLVGEANGRKKYLEHPERLYVEKLREESLEAVGLEVANWGWDHAYRRDGGLEQRVRRGMARGALNTLDPRVRFVPMTLDEVLEMEKSDRRLAG